MKLLAGTLLLLAANALAQNAPAPTMTADEKRFQESMQDVALVGYFTSGDKSELKEDRYVIERVTKVKDDTWNFEARIQYNKKDVKVTMPLPVKFAGDTPVISLTNFAVPGFGSFTARVLIYDGAYAGTWGDARHGGKLFGKIVKNTPAAAQPPPGADNNEDLLAASRAGDLAAVKAAVEKGAAIESKSPYGQTPLYVAAMNGHEPVVRFLLEKGASVDVRDTFYKAPMLSFVVQRKHFAIAKLLIPKSTAPPDEKLPLVAGSGNAEMVQAVLDSGKPSQAALNRTYEQALARKQPEVAALLKKAGAQEPAPAVAVDAAVLASYVGSFKSEQLPLEIKVFVKEGQLYLQATSQPELALKPLSATRFEFVPAQIEINFDSADSFTLKQGGGTFKFTKVVAR